MSAVPRPGLRAVAALLLGLLAFPGTALAQTSKGTEGPPAPSGAADTSGSSDVLVSSWVVWIDQGPVVAVQHDLQVENSGDADYVGSETDGEEGPRVLEVPLAAGAQDLQFLGRFTECCAEVRGSTFVHTTPIEPGTVQGTLRYTTASLERLELPVTLPTARLTLLVPPNLTVTSDRLRSDGQMESQGNTYSILTVEGLEPGDVVEVGLAGLATGETEGTPVLPLLVAGAVLLLGLLGAALWWRARGARTARGRDGHVAEPRRGSGKDAPTTDVDRPVDQVDLLIEEIALLDLAFDRGLVARDVYDRLRAARKSELVELRTLVKR